MSKVVEVGNHHTYLCKEVAEIIDDFFPIRPNYENRWTYFLLKVVHNWIYREVAGRVVIESEFRGRRTFQVKNLELIIQSIRTRALTQLRGELTPVAEFYQDELPPMTAQLLSDHNFILFDSDSEDEEP